MSGSDDKASIGSPPLILACLAIGIFSAALISVFGWRRMQIARGITPRGIDGRALFGRHGLDSWGNLGERPGMDEKPIMWEVWTNRDGRVTSVDYGCWDQVMPLALHSTPPKLSNHETSTGMNPPALSTTSLPLPAERRRPFRDFTPTTLFPLYQRTPAPGLSLRTDATENDEEDQVGKITEVAEKKETRVVIIVEMPSVVSSRRRHNHFLSGKSESKQSYNYYSAFSKSETLVETHDNMREELLGLDSEVGERQYCIGVCGFPSSVSTKLKDDKEASRTIQDS